MNPRVYGESPFEKYWNVLGVDVMNHIVSFLDESCIGIKYQNELYFLNVMNRAYRFKQNRERYFLHDATVIFRYSKFVCDEYNPVYEICPYKVTKIIVYDYEEDPINNKKAFELTKWIKYHQFIQQFLKQSKARLHLKTDTKQTLQTILNQDQQVYEFYNKNANSVKALSWKCDESDELVPKNFMNLDRFSFRVDCSIDLEALKARRWKKLTIWCEVGELTDSVCKKLNDLIATNIMMRIYIGLSDTYKNRSIEKLNNITKCLLSFSDFYTSDKVGPFITIIAKKWTMLEELIVCSYVDKKTFVSYCEILKQHKNLKCFSIVPPIITADTQKLVWTRSDGVHENVTIKP